ncbi:hypothetical protein BH708_03750 [Brachybacterium sp. P6-10-X1]|uniref:hypothetical protein n=1 Tax=Brachybacterium sp. P6-10-X1 TaxID=1903186 RepID=UPI000971AE6F|nr:hypothetical protein [Brachybacterium sp. P6-10-X1]APX31988.1 hypothetical protein BH708_03750 [Brachybacterium sp. P6-10-X1]
MNQATEFYYNLTTRTVEEGRQSPATELMGPYASREAAQHALSIAEGRNDQWDEADADWNGTAGGEQV